MKKSKRYLFGLTLLSLCAIGADHPRRLPPVHSTTDVAALRDATPLVTPEFDRVLRRTLAALDRQTIQAPAEPPAATDPSAVSDESVGESTRRADAAPRPQTGSRLDRFTAALNRYITPQFEPQPEIAMQRLATTETQLPPLPADLFGSDTAVSGTAATNEPLIDADRSVVEPPPQSPTAHARTTTLAETLAQSPHAEPSPIVLHDPGMDFSPMPLDPDACYHDSGREAWVYDAKRDVPTQHPWVEWGRVWYGDGITPRGRDLFGPMNLVRPKFYAYGDFRTGIQAGRNAGGRADNWANRLNLDLDFQITDTERFHAFVGPLDKQNRFTRWEVIDGDLHYRNEMNLTPATAFFEGDLGVMLGALGNQSSPFELPISAGLMPLLFQNGIWMEDAVSGIAFALPAKHSRLLNWANFDVSFFAVFDQLNSPAFADNSDAQAFGTAWFIEAYGGYIETGYAYLNHRNDDSLSYHNATFSFTRRYFDRISNSVRVIVNAGQDRVRADRTADGGLLLVENSWITAAPLTVVPYANVFYGWDRPQSVARAGISGGILRNTGINFDTDGLNGFATLDTSAADTAGGSIGVDLIGDDLDRQLLLELSYLTPHGDRAIARGDQYAIGARYQFPISNATLLRFDVMHGWREGDDDVYGTRMEYRWKF
ncbi:hypothetical protein NZK35_15070 [Stieleria sp. ICT_E10.1]|uniref:hypothetical protein n=1 Tax=Stieleria sedimenti TaxID=2976331 RepID=UPI00217F7BB0|nr:hypothetical protein [Stieleria sedimenti]MCS7467974.1 hypothetical protein [Stieleria sedimenti]